MVSKTIFDYVQNKKYIPNYIVTSFIIQDTQLKNTSLIRSTKNLLFYKIWFKNNLFRKCVVYLLVSSRSNNTFLLPPLSLDVRKKTQMSSFFIR
jgi:hypothetical protein